ncbi:unnamed protein product [Polarella glacialis]|uniref:Pentatricopeptide repeat-containing protein, chloroplastic n=1 Tax=Polarella glacialis TaxID=89957 RepID=A0A813DKS9_POLGL|nr:unnamed protein product [Polarella glacialis]
MQVLYCNCSNTYRPTTTTTTNNSNNNNNNADNNNRTPSNEERGHRAPSNNNNNTRVQIAPTCALAAQAGLSAMARCHAGAESQVAGKVVRSSKEMSGRAEVMATTAAASRAMRLDSGRWRHSLWLLAAMLPERGLRPDLTSLSTALSACSRGQCWALALQLLSEVDSWGSDTPDIVVCSAGIDICGKAGRWVSALQLLGNARQCGLEMNAITFNAAISSCERGRSWQRAVDLFGEMCSRGVELSTSSFNTLATACSSGRRWCQVLQLLSEAGHRDLGPDALGENAALSACAVVALWQRAITLLGTRKKIPFVDRSSKHLGAGQPQQRRQQDELVSWTSVIAACSGAGHWELAQGLFSSMLLLDVRPTIVTRNAVLGGEKKQKK